jgi:hypothetical protein
LRLNNFHSAFSKHFHYANRIPCDKQGILNLGRFRMKKIVMALVATAFLAPLTASAFNYPQAQKTQPAEGCDPREESYECSGNGGSFDGGGYGNGGYEDGSRQDNDGGHYDGGGYGGGYDEDGGYYGGNGY